MAILNYFRVYSTATTPASPAQESIPNPRGTKIILPKKKPMKWTNGLSPGDYGGPPTTTKLRKYWGGKQEDPVTSSDLIWNKDFMPQMEKLVQDKPGPDSSTRYPPAKKESSGFLSLSRAMSLDNMDVDLSASLIPSPKAATEQQAETTQVTGKATQRWKLAPTRKEQDKWDRATKAATGGSEVMFRELRKPRGDPRVLAAQSREKYDKLKKKLQLVTLGIGGLGIVSAYVCYTPEIAASFGAGLIGSLVYIRMLGNTVDSMANASGGLINQANYKVETDFLSIKGSSTAAESVEQGLSTRKNLWSKDYLRLRWRLPKSRPVAAWRYGGSEAGARIGKWEESHCSTAAARREKVRKQGIQF